MRLNAANPTDRTTRTPGRPGYVIIAVLVVVVVLSLAAYKFTDLMSAEYRASVRTASASQARTAAASGVHHAAAALADPNSYYGELGGQPWADGAFHDAAGGIDVRPAGDTGPPARFFLVAVVPDGSGGYEQRYGAVVDEAGKLNINALIQLDPSGEKLYAALMELPGMTSEVADAIVDWVDPDDDARPGGAETSTYLGMGYRAKNGPLNSLDELLLVNGVTPQLLYGSDRNQNGIADEPGGQSGDQLRGWADYLTVYGRELNLDSTGVLRENVNDSEDLPGLYDRLTARLGPELADYVMAYKLFGVSKTTTTTTSQTTVVGGPAELSAAVQATLQSGLATNRRRLKSFLDLRNTQVTLPKVPGAPADAPKVVVPSPLNDPARLGELLGQLMDKTTTTAVVELTPRLNVNTAPKQVLMSLVGITGGGELSSDSAALTETDIDNIIANRDGQDPAAPATLTGAWLMTAGGMNPDTFKKIEKYVTGRSMVFRVQAVGYVGPGGKPGPTARVEAVIDTNQGAPRVLYYRDLSGLSAGFDLPTQ